MSPLLIPIIGIGLADLYLLHLFLYALSGHKTKYKHKIWNIFFYPHIYIVKNMPDW